MELPEIHETLYLTFTLFAFARVTMTEWFRLKLLPQSRVISLTFPRVRAGPLMVTVELVVVMLL